MEIMGLIEDPQGMTVRRILLEADVGGGAVVATSNAAAVPEATRRPIWISPAPVAVKMRLFCLPYAGGVSENVFGRYVRGHQVHGPMLIRDMVLKRVSLLLQVGHDAAGIHPGLPGGDPWPGTARGRAGHQQRA